MGGSHRELDVRGPRLALLGVAAVTATATAVVAPAPTPTALLAQSQQAVNLAAATTPYQAFQHTVDAVLPALVNQFGRPPTVTLQTLLAQIPPSLLTDVLNANVGNINVPSLLNLLSPDLVSGLTSQVGSGTTSQLSSAISAAVSAALGTALSGLTGTSFLSTLQTGLVSALVAPLQTMLGGLSITVPLLGIPLNLSGLVNVSGLATTVANLVATDLIGQLTTGITSGLTGSLSGSALTNGLGGTLAGALSGIVAGNLGDLVNPLLQAAGFEDAAGNIGVGSLLNLAGLNLGSLVESNAISVTTAGPAFTLARLLGVDLGWTPGTETAIGARVNNTAYFTLGTDTLKNALATNLTNALGTGALATILTPILTSALTSTLTNSLTTSLTTALTSALTTTVDGTVGSTSTLTSALTTAISTAVGDLGLSYIPLVGSAIDLTGTVVNALNPLIGGLVTGLTSGTSISTLVNATVSSTVTSVVGSVVTGATSGLSGTVSSALTGVLSSAVLGVVNAIPSIDVGSVRIPIVVGTGLGAFSAGAAYRDVLAKLSSQPGGLHYSGATSIAGSLTLLPEILLNNAGRANGGVLARFSSVLRLLGINAVTPDVAITSSGGTAVGSTGLALGGANLVPVKVDATVEYQPLSDFAAWANPVTLMNNLAAGLLSTYILRGVDQATTAGQLITQLESMVTNLQNGGQTNTNIYLTAAANHLPLLEPVYLAGDAMNLMGLTPVGNAAYRLGNALSPVLTSLVNLGYSDAYWDPASGQYLRTLSTAATPVQFGTLPNIDWSKVGPRLFTSLVTGFEHAFTGPVSMPNAISQAISLISKGGNLLSLGALPSTTAAVKAPTALPTAATAPTATANKSKTPTAIAAVPTAAETGKQTTSVTAAETTPSAATESPSPEPKTQEPAKPKHAADDADAGATGVAGAAKDGAASDDGKPAAAGKDKGKGERKAGKPKGTKSPKPKDNAASADSSAAAADGDSSGTGRHRAPSSTGGKHRAPESGSGKHAA
ncbi:PE-PPE domain-containing protein [Mycolicibacterium llatzerense]|uniref:PE-PPE domain-containing protein n=1 Tax=Mycolicibacterium llatzerense TaxID=280871 RepID=UPI0021B4DC14|nr:PE-PPE domain-containing protein [Mycolicibacterium llatzerense]